MLTDDEILIGLDYEPYDLIDPEIRASIREVSRQLETAGLAPMNLLHARNGTVMASSTLLGPYLVSIAQIVIPTLGIILIAWIKAPGRRVRVKVGDTLIEATSVEDIERLIPQLKELQGKGSRKKPLA